MPFIVDQAPLNRAVLDQANRTVHIQTLSAINSSGISPAPGGMFPSVSKSEQREMFDRFVDEWMRDTENLSGASSVLIHPSYHKILAMGESALPYIFEDFALDDGAKWLGALDAIVLGKVNPVKPEHEDDARLMCEDWLEWGLANGFIV